MFDLFALAALSVASVAARLIAVAVLVAFGLVVTSAVRDVRSWTDES